MLPTTPPLTATAAKTTVAAASYQLDIANHPTHLLVDIVSDLLNSIIESNDRLIHDNTATTVTHFHSRAIPNISVYAYLTRILKFAPFSNEVLLCLLIYFDRIAKLKKAKYAVNSLTVHRLLITSIVVASKFTSDVFYPNTRYAKVGGIPLCELNQLELEFLFLCNFDLHVKLEDMQAYGDQLLTHALTKQPCTMSPLLEVASSLPESSPPLSPTEAPLKRKRAPQDSAENECKIMKRSEALLDKALVKASVKATGSATLLCNKLYTLNSSHHYHLDTILSTYTHD